MQYIHKKTTIFLINKTKNLPKIFKKTCLITLGDASAIKEKVKVTKVTLVLEFSLVDRTYFCEAIGQNKLEWDWLNIGINFPRRVQGPLYFEKFISQLIKK